MEIAFLILAFIGTFSCGFFFCLAILLAVAAKQTRKDDKIDKRDKHRLGNVQRD